MNLEPDGGTARLTAMADAPQTTVYRQLPIRAHSFWDRYPDVKEALRQLELGYFRRAAFLMDATMQDDRIYGVWSTRTNAITAAPVTMKATGKSSRAIKYAEELQGSDDEPGLWKDIVSDSAMSDLTRWGKTLGIGVAQIEWTGSPRRTTPRLVPWHPQFVRFDWSEYTYKVLTADGSEVSLPRVDQNPMGDGQWFVYTPYGFYGGWLMGMIRWLAGRYIMRGWNYRDWARFNEVYGSPLRKAYVPAGEQNENKDAFFADVANAGAEATVMIPVGKDETPETAKYNVELMEYKGRGTDTFKDFKQELDSDIAIGILGQNLTTQVSGGSFAATKEHTLVRIDVARADAAIATPLRQQVLSWDAKFNYGSADLAPRPVIEVDPPEDELNEAQTLATFGAALGALEDGGDDRIDIEAVIQEFGLPMRTPEEVAAIKADKMARQQAMASSLGSVSSDEDPEQGGPEGQGGDQKPKPPKKARALSVHEPVKRYTFQGLPIAVENPAGSIRRWYDAEAKETGSTTMRYDYGYIEGALGNDKEELDVYVGHDENAPDVHIVHQRRAPDFKSYDEDKTFLGFSNAAAAKEAFLQHRSDGAAAFGTMSTIPLERFKAKLKRRTTGRKIHASAAPDDAKMTSALIGLTYRSRKALRAPRSVAGKQRQARYVDKVERSAIAGAARRLAPYRKELEALVKDATDLRALQRSILATYRDKMDPDRLADLLHQTFVLSHLAGRETALQQT